MIQDLCHRMSASVSPGGRGLLTMGGKVLRSLLLTIFTGLLSMQAAQAAPVAALLRATLDNKPVDEKSAVVTPKSIEDGLIGYLQEKSHTPVDLTPLHADFQKLKYTSLCPVSGGEFSYDNCAKFDQYAEAVLHVVNNIGEGVKYGAKELQPLKGGGYILIVEVKAIRKPRAISGQIHLEVRGFCDKALVAAEDFSHSTPIGAKGGPDFALSQFYDDIVYRGLQKVAEKFAQNGPTC